MPVPPPMPANAAGQGGYPGQHNSQHQPLAPGEDDGKFGRKRTALTEFERQQAKIQKKRKIKEKQVVREIKAEEEQARQVAQSKILRLGESVSVNELATNVGVPVTELIGKLFKMGIMAASLVAGVIGFLLLRKQGRVRRPSPSQAPNPS